MSTEDETVDAFKLLVFQRASLDEPGQLKIITYSSGLKLLIHCCRREVPASTKSKMVTERQAGLQNQVQMDAKRVARRR